jgi:hypothetical protein
VASVHAVLARFPAPWLLVFDNAADPASVTAFLPPAGPGQVLITSQNPNWPGQAVEVPVLAADVAAEFLMSRTGDRDAKAARDLAGLLGGLPLALEQAAAYIQATGDTLAGYLELFRQRRAELLTRGEPAGYSKTVASTWALTFDRLQQTQPGAISLLRLLAFCAPEAIPLRLLLQPRPGLADRVDAAVFPVLIPLLEDPLAARDAVGALRRYSLISVADRGSVSVHRLVQAITIDTMPADLAAAWQHATAVAIEAAIPDTDLPESWPRYAELLPHAQAVLPPDSEGMEQVANYLGVRGNYAAARDLLEQVLGAREQTLGREHPLTLTARHNTAAWTGAAGNTSAARDQFASLLPVRETVLGAEHPDTLAVRHQLAESTGEAGDAAGARDQYAALLPVRQRILGPDHPGSLANRGNLARWTGEAGDAASARDQFAALLPSAQQALGPDDVGTLETRRGLATWTGHAGDAASARAQLAGLLPAYERVLGQEHPATLQTRNDLAYWTGKAGDTAAAQHQLADMITVAEQALGDQHPVTIAIRRNFAYWSEPSRKSRHGS